MKKSTLALAFGTAALLVGCGGGGGSSSPGTGGPATTQGHLVDSGVKGALYVCGTQRGTTDESGLFVCDANATSVTFYIGKLLLGWTAWPTPDGDVRPQDLAGVPRTTFNDPEVIKIAQFLQSLDKDGNPENGIEIDSGMAARFDTGVQIKNVNLDELIATAGVTAVDAQSALEHLQNTFLPHSSSSAEAGSSSSSHSGGLDSISSSDLAGYTVVAEYKSGTKINDIEKVSYIFLSNHKAIVVFEIADGSVYVARDDNYHESDGNNVALQNLVFDDGKQLGAFFVSGITTPNEYNQITVGQSTALPYTVTAILSNDENGIDEATVKTHIVSASSSSSSASTNSELNNAKNLTIYNHANIAKLMNGTTFDNQKSYESDTPMHCTDYGFGSAQIKTEDTGPDGAHVLSYMFTGEAARTKTMCLEFDEAGTSYEGSTNIAYYN